VFQDKVIEEITASINPDNKLGTQVLEPPLVCVEPTFPGAVPEPPAALDNCAKPIEGVPLFIPSLEVVPRKTV